MPIFGAKFVHQFGGKAAFGRAQCIRVPFWGIAVADGYKSGFTPHGQAHVPCHEFLVNRHTELHHRRPLLLGVGLGHTRRLVDAGDLHFVAELDFGFVNTAFYRCGTRRLRRAGQR